MRRSFDIKSAPVALLFLAGVAFGADTNSPPPPKPASPVAYFRKLLVMTDSERLAELANRPEAQRAGLEAKIEQYASMPANERELRLRATELRFFLLPLMRLPRDQREARLKSVPEDIRELVEDRLAQWDLIPPGFKEELLQNQAALQLFSRMNPQSPPNADELMAQLPASRTAEMDADMDRWQALSPKVQSQLLKGFNHFFQLTTDEQERTLRTLSPEERTAMQKTLRQYDALPTAQRIACIRAFQKFVLLPPGERAQFLKNADRWQAMSPEDREQWRTVVDQLAQMPPLPPGVEPVLIQDTPPLPPGLSVEGGLSVTGKP